MFMVPQGTIRTPDLMSKCNTGESINGSSLIENNIGFPMISNSNYANEYNTTLNNNTKLSDDDIPYNQSVISDGIYTSSLSNTSSTAGNTILQDFEEEQFSYNTSSSSPESGLYNIQSDSGSPTSDIFEDFNLFTGEFSTDEASINLTDSIMNDNNTILYNDVMLANSINYNDNKNNMFNYGNDLIAKTTVPAAVTTRTAGVADTTLTNININNIISQETVPEIKSNKNYRININDVRSQNKNKNIGGEFDPETNGQIDHNYTINNKNNISYNMNKEKITILRNEKIPKLKVKINQNGAPRVATSIFNETNINTPDVTEGILDMESTFNIIDYINSDSTAILNIKKEDSGDDKEIKDKTTSRKRNKSPGCPLMELLSQLKSEDKTGMKRRRISLSSSMDLNPGSVQSSVSSDYDSLPKRRGRPPKPVISYAPSSSGEDKNMSENEKYRELRDKNNEASRRSRQNRKQRETKLESEANDLIRKHKKLAAEEAMLIKRVATMKEALKTLTFL